jgi:pyruvate dehydrogenase E2 component (dihydrolipoamide acetyltransferase)
MAVRDFLLPDLGEGLEDAEVVAWKVAEGDTVELNQTLVEVNTAKALVEIPAPWEGVVTKLHAAEGDVVEVGTPLVSIDVEAADGAADQPAEEVGEQAAEAATEEAEGSKPKRQAVLVGYGVEEEDELARARRSRVAKTQGEPDETDAPAAAVATTPRFESWPRRWAWTWPRSPAPAPTAASPARTSSAPRSNRRASPHRLPPPSPKRSSSR